MVTFCSRLIHLSSGAWSFVQVGCKIGVQLCGVVCFCNQMHLLFLWPDSPLSLQLSIHIVDAYNACTFFFVVLVQQQDEVAELNYIIHLLES